MTQQFTAPTTTGTGTTTAATPAPAHQHPLGYLPSAPPGVPAIMSSADAKPPIGPETFNERAATWDLDPRRIAITEDIAREITATLPLASDWRVFDYGCGTGALATRLLPHVREIFAADAAHGMVAEVERKRDALPPADAARLHPLLLDLTKTPNPFRFHERFHLIIASLVIHHVKDVPALLALFGKLLLPGGHLVIVEWSNTTTLEEHHAHPGLKPSVNGFAPDELATLVAKVLDPVHAAWRVFHYLPRDDGSISPAFLLRVKRLPHTVCTTPCGIA